MTSRTITHPDDLPPLYAVLGSLKLPFTVKWAQGKDRSENQNRTAFMWYKQISEQMGDRTTDQVRAACKLDLGVRIIHAENEDFREQWNRLIRGRFSYEELLDLMLPPHDYPVTRIMNTEQMTQYLEAIIEKYAAQGVTLTMPEDRL